MRDLQLGLACVAVFRKSENISQLALERGMALKGDVPLIKIQYSFICHIHNQSKNIFLKSTLLGSNNPMPQTGEFGKRPVAF